MTPDSITSSLVQMLIDAHGTEHPPAVNRDRTFLEVAMKQGKSKSFVTTEAPIALIKTFMEKADGRYLED
ncbi:hypothetical protein [Microbulbifer sp. A4B17]|uniref:hypothetical protein n=1 Tax=Microbulbifer sp. A4B17 TaxID=359370 RepID=UPI001863CC34|nr:hypothetical protein [Microbulbifer sp. A4B17]